MTTPVRAPEGSAASTIIQTRPPSVTGLPRAKLSSKAGQAIATARVTTGAVMSPERLGKMLVDMQEDVATSVANISRSPIISGRLFVGVTASVGTLNILRHGFGRPALGYYVTRTYFGAAAPVAFSDGVLPNGIPSTGAIALVPSGSGTCDVWVF